MILAKIADFFSPSEEKKQAAELYLACVERSRNSFFYEQGGVPDTLDGRFDVIVLHIFLELQKIRQNKDKHQKTSLERALVENFFADMDRNLREIGISDTGMTYRMKDIASAFYGRLHAYSESFADKNALKEVLKRNLYGSNTPDDAQLLAVLEKVITYPS